MTLAMKLYHWEKVDREQMNPHLTRQVIHGDKMTVARIHLKKGGVVPLHHHINEQLSILEKGKLRFAVGDKETIMEPGDMVMIPGDVPHMVEALEDSVAVDINSPVREDWLRGDDAYLRR